MRIALYWAPEPTSLLGKAASEWLQTTCSKIPHVSDEDLRDMLSAPRHYGFHATLKPPFRLKAKYCLEDVEREVTLFVNKHDIKPFPISPLEVSRIGQFFCLREREPSAQLHCFADEVVRQFDIFREPATVTELESRRAKGLTERQEQLLLQWGYPYVLDEFRFHLTLSNTISRHDQSQAMFHELSKRFEKALKQPLLIDSLSMFIQHGNQPFEEHQRWKLTSR